MGSAVYAVTNMLSINDIRRNLLFKDDMLIMVISFWCPDLASNASTLLQ